VLITRRFDFSASHHYHRPEWTQAENEAAFGPNVRQHGHNYRLDVSIEGPIDAQTGMILNLTEVKHIVGRVLERYDHRNLNVDHPAFAERLPTTEHIAIQLALEIAPALPEGVRLARVRLWETEDLFAEVLP
jgi:6-pyruvoyltetrahydropterin/6-carboxytetrahydropterin synthase